MAEWSDELRGFVASLVTLVLILFIVAACVAGDRAERGETMQMCIEKTEKPQDCAVFGDTNLYR